MGPAFIEDLRRELGRLYPDCQPYEPEEILYNDDVSKTPSHLGKEILKAVDAHSRKSGFGLVIIPEIKRRVREEDKLGHLVMRELRERDRTTILLTTHDMTEAEELCDRIAIMEGGRIVALGTPAGLRRLVESPNDRPASLEDVFLELTGKQLVDETVEV